MMRYLRLYLYFVRFSFSKAFEFRIDFWFRILMDIVYYGTALGFVKVVFLHTSDLGGWTEEQALVFITASFVLDAVHMTVTANNIHILPTLVNSGQLDYYLVRPVSSVFFLSLREFAANSALNLAAAISLHVWALSLLPDPIQLDRLLLFYFFLANGVLLYYILQVLFILPVFWTHSTKGLITIFYSLMRFMERPDGIYFGAMRWAMFTVLPFALMVSVPCRVLFGDEVYPLLLNVSIVTAVFMVFFVVAWRRALSAYSSASS